MSEQQELNEISAQRFRECLEQTFRIRVGEEHVDCQLVEVKDLGGDTPRADRVPYSLLFRGPVDCPLEQQIFPLKNETMGELQLFLVTVGPDPKHDSRGMLYEAIVT